MISILLFSVSFHFFERFASEAKDAPVLHRIMASLRKTGELGDRHNGYRLCVKSADEARIKDNSIKVTKLYLKQYAAGRIVSAALADSATLAIDHQGELRLTLNDGTYLSVPAAGPATETRFRRLVLTFPIPAQKHNPIRDED
jgi:hypothetical protein